MPEVEVHSTDEPTRTPAPELAAAPEPPPAKPAAPGPVVPAALLDHARKLAEAHQASTGSPMPADTLSARLGLPADMTRVITNQLQLT
ncbi:hypothetical protein ACIHEJ_35685 [Streptomyces sp. NPDC052301]|uniref:hypothetical protein n=1 Tax=Streptomyces sp. NPDC052301 TaxID=3365687 RepID=UPI0037D1EF9B